MRGFAIIIVNKVGEEHINSNVLPDVAEFFYMSCNVNPFKATAKKMSPFFSVIILLLLRSSLLVLLRVFFVVF